MTVEALLSEVRGQLKERVDPAYREGANRFFQEAVLLHGVRQAALVPIERFVYHELKLWPAEQRNRFCTEMWKQGTLEEGALVCHVYRRFQKECAAAEFRLFESWIDCYVTNWAHCDGVSSWLLAACIANDQTLIDLLPAWTASANRWKRRAAAVSLLQEAKAGRNTGRIFEVALPLLRDPDLMVQKGVGWLLKETYPKKPRPTVTFLRSRSNDITRLVLRYAAEKMSPADKASVLA